MDQPLSYKKPTKEADKAGTTGDGAPGKGAAGDGGGEPTSRKVLSRRQALKEFYHLQQQQQKEQQEQDKTPAFNDHEKFNDQEKFNEYLKTTPIQDILRLRNSITTELTSHELEKKSIIYDNYYELIKLNETLEKLSRPMVPKQQHEFHKVNDVTEKKQVIDGETMKNTLLDLKSFVERKTAFYNQEFPAILEKLLEDFLEELDDTSTRGIVGADDLFAGLDKKALAREVDAVLDGRAQLDWHAF